MKGVINAVAVTVQTLIDRSLKWLVRDPVPGHLSLRAVGFMQCPLQS